MGLIAKEGGSFELVPAGVYSAVCTRVIDLGLQHNMKFGKDEHKVLIQFEIDAKMTDGKPFMIGNRYTVSLGQKAHLRADLESWRGRPFTQAELDAFDLRAVLGAPAMLNVMHSPDGKYSNIASIMPLPRGMQKLAPVGELLCFDTENWDEAVFQKLSDKLKERIMARTVPGSAPPPAPRTTGNGPFDGIDTSRPPQAQPQNWPAPQPKAPPAPAMADADFEDEIPF